MSFEEIFETKQRQGKKKGKKSTDIFLTINLNQKFANLTQEEKLKFKAYAVKLFDEKEILQYIRDRESPDNPLGNVDHVGIEWKAEIGPERGLLHLHALVAIQHHGFLSFRVNELRAYSKKYFGHGVHIDAPISSNERIKWLNYINKNSA